MKTLYMQARPEDIAPNVIFSGDPGRVEKVGKYLTEFRSISANREFTTFTGAYKGMPVTVTSTGIGAPSAAIAVEEMYECGMKTAVRMGTVMGLHCALGSFVIPAGAMRMEATSATYVPAGYPAVADFSLVGCMNTAAEALGQQYGNGLVCSMDGFYSQMHTSRLAKQTDTDIDAKIDILRKLNITGIDMETSVLLTLTSLMGIQGCSVTYTTVLDNLKDVLPDEVRKKGEEILIQLVLEGLLLHFNQ